MEDGCRFLLKLVCVHDWNWTIHLHMSTSWRSGLPSAHRSRQGHYSIHSTPLFKRFRSYCIVAGKFPVPRISPSSSLPALALSILPLVVLNNLGRPVCSNGISSATIFANSFAANQMTGIPWPLNPERMDWPGFPGTTPI